MKKRVMNYVTVLPRELRQKNVKNCLSKIPESTLHKLAEPEMKEQKAKKFPRKKLFK